MNALSVLKQDHANVEQQFRRFETAEPGDLAEKASARDLIVEQLSVHAAIEEQVFYPAVRECGDEVATTVLESLEEHHIVKWTLSELDGMDPSAERFDAKMTVLIEQVRHHVKEEEEEMFPLLRERLTVEQLNRIGEQLEEARAVAPRRPHPRLPDNFPLNVLVGVPLALVDRAMHTGREAVGRVLNRS